MTSIAVAETRNLDIHVIITVTGISALPTDEPHVLQTILAGGWIVELTLPLSNESAVGVFIYRPSNFIAQYEHVILPPVFVEIRTLSLFSDQIITWDSFHWDDIQEESGVNRGWFDYCSWETLWLENYEVQRDDGFRLAVDIPSTERPFLSNNLMLRHISQFTKGIDVVDMQFLAFSRHLRRGGEIDRRGAQSPLPVYASSGIIQDQCHYFRTISRSPEFAEAKDVPFDRPPSHREVETYGYESDSDLSYFSDDSDDEGNVDDCHNDGYGRPHEAGHSKLVGKESKQPVPRGGSGRVIAVQDTAYVTLRAMLFYMSTSQISFAPLSSQNTPRLRARSYSERISGFPPKPSAKSIYRLADKLGLDDIRKLSLTHIWSQLTTKNIVQELFSNFTSLYPAVRDIELDFAFQHWDEIKSSAELREKVMEIAHGEHPDCAETLTALLAETVIL